MKKDIIVLANKCGYIIEDVMYNKKEWYIQLCLLQKWLREKHKFFVEVCLYEYPKGDLDNFNITIRHPKILSKAEDGYTLGGYEYGLENGILDSLKILLKYKEDAKKIEAETL